MLGIITWGEKPGKLRIFKVRNNRNCGNLDIEVVKYFNSEACRSRT